MLITRRVKSDRILQGVDGNLLVMFAGLFVVTKATQQLGLLDSLTNFTNTPPSLLGVTVILSNLISNVPAVLVLQSLIVKTDTSAWLMLAAGSTMAGNLTLLSSVANLIVAEVAAKSGYNLTCNEHLWFGLPLTGVTLVIAYFGLYEKAIGITLDFEIIRYSLPLFLRVLSAFAVHYNSKTGYFPRFYFKTSPLRQLFRQICRSF